ncbi:exonuclease domain-containing protein [Rothia sp. AR01]|uniref:Exonuclease domain-containing protein n=1 Tax=Rothia santali TaxID=2949643 RepID=A0A9X2HCL1_9MICC|nr:exonuclease domain-containing protein [Rothia santali]MCP3426876.1 exonuclease domain-containing protein [Rothia santali]
MTPPGLDFVAIDFETANADPASVCQVGVAKVLGGRVVEVDSWLVVPPTGVAAFDPRNVGIHGIKPKDVLRSGIQWLESARRLERLRGGLPYVAHNAAFDRGVLEAACRMSDVEIPACRWEDTLKISREYLDSPNHKLPTVAQHLGLPRFMHHDAAADAQTCALVAIRIAELAGAGDVDALWPAGSSAGGAQARWFDRASKAKASELPQPAADAHPGHPLFGHRVVITGEVPGMTRWEVFEAIAAGGGTPQKGVTLKTTLLVVADRLELAGDYDPSAGGGKERKAHEYQGRGKPIRFIGRSDFEEHLEWAPDDAGEAAAPAVSPGDEAPVQEERPPEEAPALDASPSGEASVAGEMPREEAPTAAAPSPGPAIDHRPAVDHRPVTDRPDAPSEAPSPSRDGISSRPVHGGTPASTPAPAPHADRGGGAQRVLRKILGWVLLVLSSLVTVLYLIALVVGLVQDPPAPAIMIGVLGVSLVMLLVPAGLIWLGEYLVWGRDRRRRRRERRAMGAENG